MTSEIPEGRLARWLLRLPLASARELAPFLASSEATVYRSLSFLERHGLAAHVIAGRPLVPPSRRYWLTPAGISTLARIDHKREDELLTSFPISREWLHALLRRLDSLIAVYQVAAAVADSYYVDNFRWYRTIPLDAAVHLEGSSWFGIHREGPLATLFHRRRRLRTMADAWFMPDLLALVPDSWRQQDWLRRMRHLQIRGAVAIEEGFLTEPRPDARVWLRRGSARHESLEEVLGQLDGSHAPRESPFRQNSPPPESFVADPINRKTALKDYELPLVLKPFEKEIIDLITAWPLMTVNDLADFLGITRQGVDKALRTPIRHGVVDRIFVNGDRVSPHALPNRGLIMLAKRDRLPTQHTLHAWSAEPRNGSYGPDDGWDTADTRGTRMRPLMRAITHTAMVCSFFAIFHRQAREDGGRLANAESFHRSWRGFADRDGYAGQLRPDGYGVFTSGTFRVPFFVEWERRANKPGLYIDKLRPYIRYYKSDRADEEPGEWPVLLLVLRDATAEDGFWRVASDQLRWHPVGDRLRVPTSTAELALDPGPLRRVWRVRTGAVRQTLAEALAEAR